MEVDVSTAMMGLKDGGDELSPDAIFVKEYLKSGNAKVACVRAGLARSDYPLDVVAEHHLSRPEIKSAIEVLRSEFEQRRTVDELPTRELQLEKLEAVYRGALEDGVYGAATSAIKLQNELLGYADKTVTYNFKVSAQELDLATLRAMVSEKMHERLPAPSREIEALDAEFSDVEEGEDGDEV